MSEDYSDQIRTKTLRASTLSELKIAFESAADFVEPYTHRVYNFSLQTEGEATRIMKRISLLNKAHLAVAGGGGTAGGFAAFFKVGLLTAPVLGPGALFAGAAAGLGVGIGGAKLSDTFLFDSARIDYGTDFVDSARRWKKKSSTTYALRVSTFPSGPVENPGHG